MKNMKHILLILTALALVMGSCVRDHAGGVEEGVDVSILIATGSAGSATTRAGKADGSGIDSDISHFRVLIFDSKTGVLAHKDAFTPPANPQQINMKTGVYDFVLIANDNVDAVTTQLGALTVGTSKLNDLKDMTFASSSFDRTTKIPMLSFVRGVGVYPEGVIALPGTDDQNEGTWNSEEKVWNVELERLAVRLDVAVTLTEGQTVSNPATLSISHIPSKVYLFQKANSGEYESVARTYADAVTTTPEAGKTVLTWDRIILPESVFSATNTAANGMTMSLTVNGSDCSAVLGIDMTNATETSRDYTLPRNTYLDITATANPKGLDCTATVADWGQAPQSVIFDDQYYLKVDKSVLEIPLTGGTASFTAETNYNITTQGYPAGIFYSPEESWIAVTKTQNGPALYKWTFAVTLPSGVARTEILKIKAGNMVKEVSVEQQ